MTGVPAGRDDTAMAGELVELLVEDLDAGFAEVVRAHQTVVYSTLLRACHHPADAEDIAAEAFLRAYRALRGYDRERIARLRLRPWLVTVALNTWRNTVRDRSRRPAQVPLDRAPEQASPGDAFERMIDRMHDEWHLTGLLSELSEDQRVAVVLRHVCDLSVSETAQVLRCPEGTVKSLVSRGLARLRDRLAERDPQGALR